MDKLCKMSLAEMAARLKTGEVRATEAVEACLARIEATEPVIGALLTVDGENALKLASEMDAKGPDPSMPLWGVPVAIKDAISTKGLRTTAASRILEDFVPIYDAHAVRRLREAGAIILSKANLDEFAMGSSTENSAFKTTRNPWNTERVPGGSSGGSAATVAAGQCFAALGSDTGGSIRQPAAFCGCVGLKPTYGRVSRYGLFAFASSMDQIGPITRTVEDSAIMLTAIAGHDSRDNTSSDMPAEDYAADLAVSAESQPLKGTRIGVPDAFFGEGLGDETRQACKSAINLAESLGAALVPVELPAPDIASAVYYILAMAEASSNLARYDGVKYGRRAPGVASLDELYVKSRSEGFGEEVKRRIMLGSYVLSSGYYDAYFQKAARVRRKILDQYLAALGKCDAIAMPVAPTTAWPLGAHKLDPIKAYLMDAYTLPANLAGLPAISLPAGIGEKSGMPVGIQLVGAPFGEKGLLWLGRQLEARLPHLPMPEITA